MKLAYGVTVWEWLNVSHFRWPCYYFVMLSVAFHWTLFCKTQRKSFNVRPLWRYWHNFSSSKAFRLDIAAPKNRLHVSSNLSNWVRFPCESFQRFQETLHVAFSSSCSALLGRSIQKDHIKSCHWLSVAHHGRNTFV